MYNNLQLDSIFRFKSVKPIQLLTEKVKPFRDEFFAMRADARRRIYANIWCKNETHSIVNHTAVVKFTGTGTKSYRRSLRIRTHKNLRKRSISILRRKSNEALVSLSAI